MKKLNSPAMNGQRGATLILALIILLVISFLAISSMREVGLESKITGNVMEQKRLFSSAEAGLREGENRFTNTSKPPETCTGTLVASNPCLKNQAQDYATDFTNTASYVYSGTGGNTTIARSTRWYVRAVNAGGINNEAEDPEYGNYAKGVGKYYYEINSQSWNPASGTAATTCTIDVVCLRSVIARVYND